MLGHGQGWTMIPDVAYRASHCIIPRHKTKGFRESAGLKSVECNDYSHRLTVSSLPPLLRRRPPTARPFT
jgi:hypothetical protein